MTCGTRRWLPPRRAIGVLFACLCLLAFMVTTGFAGVSRAAAPAEAAPPVSTPQAVIVIVDKLAMEDLSEFRDALSPLLDELSRGAAGMMNVRTAASASSANGYLSLAAGSRAAAGDWAGLALEPGETHQGIPAAAYYESLTGRPAGGSIVHLGIGELEPRGVGRPGAAERGLQLLGALLKRHGLTTALLGDADTAGERRRYGALLVMDERGIVPAGGAGGELLERDPAFPGGVRTAYERLGQRLSELLATADVIAVDLGDLARLEAMAPFLPGERARPLRAESLGRIAGFVSDVLRLETQRKRLVYVIAPSPSTMLGRTGVLITPALRWEIQPRPAAGEAAPAGLLTSATTRRPGIVTSADFVPTLLADLGLETGAGHGGRPWRTVARDGALDALLTRYGEIERVHRQRLPVIQPYFFAVLALIVAGSCGILLGQLGLWQPITRWRMPWRSAMTAFLAVPAALLLLPLFPPMSLPGTWALTAALSVALMLLATLLGRGSELGPPGALGTVTVILLVADILLGAPLMQRSLLGYDPVAGSRFYGIGNEYMGVLLGAGLIGCAWVLGRMRDEQRSAWGRRVPAFLFGALAVLMLHPRLGINVGGAISAAATAVFGYAFASNRRPGVRPLLAWAGALAAILVATAYLDARLLGEKASHLGQAMQSAADSGTDPLWSMFGRKLAVNWRLIRLTVWSRVLFVAFALLAVAVFLPNRFGAELARRLPSLSQMTKTAVTASLVALAVNDSGVVAASTLLLWPVLTLLAAGPGVFASGGDVP